MTPSMYTNETLNKTQVLAAFREYKNFGLTLEAGELEFIKWHGQITAEVKQLAMRIYSDDSIQDETIKPIAKNVNQEQTKVTNSFHESIWIVE